MATAAEIQAELAAGPQTQAALDAALLKYSPAEMAAAFPQFGNVADFNNATREAYARVQQQQQAANRAAVQADMAARGEEVRIANPGGDVQISGPRSPTMSAIPQSEIDAARARLTPEQRQFIDWQIEQTNSLTAQRVGDEYARGGVNPYLDPSKAQAQIDRAKNRQALFQQAGVTPEANLAPWQDPQWREKLKVEQDARAAAQEEARRNPGPFVTGPGPGPVVGPTPVGTVPVPGGGGGVNLTPAQIANTPGMGVGGIGVNLPPPSVPATGGGLLGGGTTTPAAPAAPVNPRIQAIQDWYNANVGRGTQQDLNRWLATSGFTAREINAALPQWGLNDLQNAMRTAIGEVAQQTPFAPAVTQPLAQPYTSIASQLPGGIDARAQEIRNWYAANEGRGTQADLDRFLASGYSAQEINRALPQWGLNDLERVIGAARQTYPDAALQRQLAAYQATAPGAQFTGAVSPYGLLTQQTQAFRNPYADTLANTALGGYNPGVYNILLDEKVDPLTGIATPVDGSGGGDDGDGPPGDTGGTPGASGSADGSVGGCVDPNVMVLLATGTSIRAGDIKVGDMLHTLHEDTMVYGDFPVEFVSIITQPKVEVTLQDGQKIIVSTTHKFLTDKNEWKEVQQMEVGESIKTQNGFKTLASVTSLGDGPVVKMTVTDAHTYIADGLVSHNKYNGGLVTAIFGPDPDGPDEGQINIQRGEYVIKKSAVKKYGKGLLDMINDGKVPAKKMKSLLG